MRLSIRSSATTSPSTESSTGSSKHCLKGDMIGMFSFDCTQMRHKCQKCGSAGYFHQLLSNICFTVLTISQSTHIFENCHKSHAGLRFLEKDHLFWYTKEFIINISGLCKSENLKLPVGKLVEGMETTWQQIPRNLRQLVSSQFFLEVWFTFIQHSKLTHPLSRKRAW